MTTKRKCGKGVGLFAIAVPLVWLITYFAIKANLWYLLATGTGRKEISVKKQRSYGRICSGGYADR